MHRSRADAGLTQGTDSKKLGSYGHTGEAGAVASDRDDRPPGAAGSDGTVTRVCVAARVRMYREGLAHELGRGCAFAARCSHARERCRTETPQLTQQGGDHVVACFAVEEQWAAATNAAEVTA